MQLSSGNPLSVYARGTAGSVWKDDGLPGRERLSLRPQG